MSPTNTNAEEVNIRDISATAEDYDTGSSPQTLPPRFRDALNRLNQELRNLDSFFLYRIRRDAKRHVDDINELLNIIEDLHRRLYSDFCNQRDQKEELQDRLSQLKDQTEAATQERDQANREIEDLKKTTARLQTSIKDFERDKTELDSPIKDLEDRNESLKAEKEKLEAVVEAKNAEIEALKASPVSATPRALIEHEASDSLPQSLSLSVPPAHTTPVVADAGDHHTHHKYDQLGFSITSFLSNLLKVELAHDQPSDGRRLNSVVTEFMFNLGSFADTADVAVSPVEGF
jgi:chromosome segregation ATPase